MACGKRGSARRRDSETAERSLKRNKADAVAEGHFRKAKVREGEGRETRRMREREREEPRLDRKKRRGMERVRQRPTDARERTSEAAFCSKRAKR